MATTGLLCGSKERRAAIGARIHVRVRGPKGERDIRRTVTTGGSFGGNPLRQEIGLGNADRILQVEVNWPASGASQKFDGMAVDSRYIIREGAARAEPWIVKSFSFR